MIFAFSGNLIYQIQVVRHQNQIEKSFNSEILEFSLLEWNKFSDLNEIKFQNNYYDVISFQKINTKIFTKVVKDDFENENRILISKIFKKSKSPLSEKKKSNIFSKHIFLKNEFIFLNIFFFLTKLQIKNGILSSKTSNFINLQEKPPCFINFYVV